MKDTAFAEAGLGAVKMTSIRALPIAFLLGLFLYASLALAAPPPRNLKADTLSGDKQVRVDFLDVGQGDAILIRSYTEKTILVDTGAPKARRALMKQLKDLGVESIDALILTHPHADHIGNAVDLLKSMPVRIVYDPGYPHTSKTYRNVLAAIKEKKVRYKKAEAGMRIRMGTDIEITLLAPPERFLHSDRSILNGNSIVMRLTYGDVAVMFTGDSEEETEKSTVDGRAPELLVSDILKVAHHGSRYSTKDAWLDAIKPAVAVIQVGEGNSYGHPHPDTMARLKARSIDTYTNSVHGLVTVRIDGKNFTVHTQKENPAF